MKFFWPILLICIFFCQAKPNTKKVAKVFHLMKRYSQLTKLERKLEDITDVPTDDEGSQNNTNGTVDEPTKNINASEATKPMDRNTDNQMQIIILENFMALDKKGMQFGFILT